MRVGMLTVVLMGLLCAVCANGAIDTSSSDTGSRAAIVDAKAKELLGLSVKDLALLLEAVPNHFRPLSSEQLFGTLERAKKLEAAGYITIETTRGLPAGAAVDDKEAYLTYLPTKNGQQVIDALGGARD